MLRGHFLISIKPGFFTCLGVALLAGPLAASTVEAQQSDRRDSTPPIDGRKSATGDAQELDIRDRTLIIDSGKSERYPARNFIHVTSAGKIFMASLSQPKVRNEYVLGQNFKFTTQHSEGPKCQLETRAMLSGQVLSLKLLSVRCDGRPMRIQGGEFVVEFVGNDCRAVTGFGDASDTSCRIVSGNALPQ